MSFAKPLGLAAALAVCLAALAGCGETVIDATKTEEALEANLTDSLGAKVSAVDCPTDVEVEPKATFSCTVEFKDGKAQTATLEILNEDADVRVTELGGANE